MKEILRRKFFATGVGSTPYSNAKDAVDSVLESFPHIPFWPQLPKRSFSENMYAQFLEGFPGSVVDAAGSRVYVDTSKKDFEKQLEKAYRSLIDEDAGYFSIGRDRAEGFFELLHTIKSSLPDGLAFIKGQITGPVSFALSLTDEKKKPILYNPELSDLLSRVLRLKIKWQVRKIKEIFDDVIIFIDEPYLVSIGSSYVNIKRADVTSKIKDLVEYAVHFEGALAGVHCCGNTDWPLLLETDIDILNFDAYNYMESLSLYPQELARFLDRGGFVAWGIVPTSKEIASENAGNLVKKLEQGIKLLEGKGIPRERLLDASMITPSCGCGTMTIEETKKVFSLTKEVSQTLGRKHL